MDDTAITITLDAETAAAFYAASPEDQRKIELLFRELVRQFSPSSGRSLGELMDEIGAKAEERGLTPEILEQLIQTLLKRDPSQLTDPPEMN